MNRLVIAGILDGIWTIITNLVGWFEEAIITCVNLVILGLAGMVDAVVSLLPDMPATPTMPYYFLDATVWGSYYFPLPFFFDEILTILLIWIAWLIVRVPLRWGKANPS